LHDAKLLDANSSPEAKAAGMADEINIFNMLEAARPRLITCSTKGTDQLFHGITGAMFAVTCPPKCLESSDPLFGNEIYEE